MEVLPADLIGESVLVVVGRIELIEGLPAAVARLVVSRRVVVLAREARLPRRARQRDADGPVAGPGVDVVRSDRASLAGHLDAEVEWLNRGRHTRPERGRMDHRAAAELGRLIRRATREEIRLDRGARHDAGHVRVDAVEDRARLGYVRSVGDYAQHPAAESVDAHARPLERRADGIEGAAGVQPIGGADQPLL